MSGTGSFLLRDITSAVLFRLLSWQDRSVPHSAQHFPTHEWFHCSTCRAGVARFILEVFHNPHEGVVIFFLFWGRYHATTILVSALGNQHRLDTCLSFCNLLYNRQHTDNGPHRGTIFCLFYYFEACHRWSVHYRVLSWWSFNTSCWFLFGRFYILIARSDLSHESDSSWFHSDDNIFGFGWVFKIIF